MKILMFLLSLILFSCVSNNLKNSYYADTVKTKSFFIEKSYVYSPVEIKVSKLGFQKINNNYIKEYLRDTAFVEFSDCVKKKIFPKMLSNDKFKFLLYKYDRLKNLDKSIIKYRSKISKNFNMSLSEKKILTEFYNKTHVRYVIVPVSVLLKKRVYDKSINFYNMDLVMENNYQVWDLLLGDVILENKFRSTVSKTFYGEDDIINSLKSMINNQAEQFYSFILNK